MEFSRREALLAASMALSAEAAADSGAKLAPIVSPKSYVLGAGDILSSIQDVTAALEQGCSVVLGPGRWEHPKPLRLTFERQSLFCLPGATLIPLFDGNCIEVEEWFCEIAVSISGSKQPRTGAPGAAIVLGMHGRHAGHSSVSGSSVIDFFGNGYQWEQGPGVDFSRSLAKDCTGIGYLCTGRYDDNNHGQFRFSHATRCGVAGYKIEKHDQNSIILDPRDSRHHSFDGAKAFACATNFIFETQGNVGTIFSELGGSADIFTRSSRGNNIVWMGTDAAYEALIDLGEQNTTGGYTSNNRFSVDNLFLKSLNLGEVYSGRILWRQGANATFSNEIVNTRGRARVLHRRGTASSRVDNFEGEVQFSGHHPLVIKETASGVIAVPELRMRAGERHQIGVDLGSFLAAESATVLVTPSAIGDLGQVRVLAVQEGNALRVSIIETRGSKINIPPFSIRWVVVNH